jgi:hypothetical protein
MLMAELTADANFAFFFHDGQQLFTGQKLQGIAAALATAVTMKP